jgi:hypothetical protein
MAFGDTLQVTLVSLENGTLPKTGEDILWTIPESCTNIGLSTQTWYGYNITLKDCAAGKRNAHYVTDEEEVVNNHELCRLKGSM